MSNENKTPAKKPAAKQANYTFPRQFTYIDGVGTLITTVCMEGDEYKGFNETIVPGVCLEAKNGKLEIHTVQQLREAAINKALNRS